MLSASLRVAFAEALCTKIPLGSRLIRYDAKNISSLTSNSFDRSSFEFEIGRTRAPFIPNGNGQSNDCETDATSTKWTTQTPMLVMFSYSSFTTVLVFYGARLSATPCHYALRVQSSLTLYKSSAEKCSGTSILLPRDKWRRNNSVCIPSSASLILFRLAISASCRRRINGLLD